MLLTTHFCLLCAVDFFLVPCNFLGIHLYVSLLVCSYIYHNFQKKKLVPSVMYSFPFNLQVLWLKKYVGSRARYMWGGLFGTHSLQLCCVFSFPKCYSRELCNSSFVYCILQDLVYSDSIFSISFDTVAIANNLSTGAFLVLVCCKRYFCCFVDTRV